MILLAVFSDGSDKLTQRPYVGASERGPVGPRNTRIHCSIDGCSGDLRTRAMHRANIETKGVR
jgi:hypothetical protein